MRIKIKTAEEFRDAHVTIEIVADDQAEAELVAERLYTAAEVGHAQASEAELVAAPLRRRIAELEARLERGHVCTPACRPNAHVAFQGRQRVTELEAEASQARRRVIELTRELEAERERADENLAWAERAEGRLAAFGLDRVSNQRALADAQAAITSLSGQLGRISGAVHGPPIHRALMTDWTSWSESDAAALTSAIRQVRDALGSPTGVHRLPRTASEPTSQA